MNVESLRHLIEQQLTLSRRLKARIRELEADAHAPLAVVGMGLRFPGGLTTPEDYWDFLNSDRDGISEIPDNRPGLRAVFDPQRDRPGHSYVNRAGFLEDVAAFDAKFFGLSNREAEAVDPQQRLLLETCWEALERAGIAVRKSDRLSVGVFIGIMADEYRERRLGQADKSSIDPYFGTGGGHCFAAGRISYVMGFSGPALSVDTACSSSLAALHLAAQSLRRRECRYAIVGGSNLLFSGDLMVSLCQSGALAPDGRSKTFTSDADGYGRGEGVGSLVLMRLDEAERQKRPILAVLRGSAVNHDGASSGLTVPNGAAQREVIRAALEDAAIAPEDVGFVEAHGTGTMLGDPIEVNALDAVFGSGAPGRRAKLVIGNVKRRIGHLEAAAGIAGIIKLVLALRSGIMPASLHETDAPLNPMIAWDTMPIEVPRKAHPWPKSYTRRIAGISAFGLSGTNAHAVFEAYQPAETDNKASLDDELILVSARDEASLRYLIGQTAQCLRACAPTELAAMAHTLRTGRAAFACRRAAIGRGADELAARLEAAARRTVQTGAAPARIQLCVNDDADTLVQTTDALSARFPALAVEQPQAEPAARLHAMLQLLVPRLRLVRVAQPNMAISLEWGGKRSPLSAQDGSAAPRLLLEALAALFEAGADLRLDGLARPGTGFYGGLPTYPFRREHFWLPEPTAMIEKQSQKIQPDSATTGASANAIAVERFVETELASLLGAGEALDRTLSFLDAGGDSFIAMLLKKTVEQRFDVELPNDVLGPELSLAALFSRIGQYVTNASIVAEATQ